jgi:hypothetical protein
MKNHSLSAVFGTCLILLLTTSAATLSLSADPADTNAPSTNAPSPNAADSNAPTPLRPPSVPLITNDPFLSIWSPCDHLYDGTTQHWTHHDQALVSLIRIDDKTYRLMGKDPENVPPLPQTSLRVLPTRSIYEFEGSGIHVTLTFMTAALPTDLDIFSRPLSYITWNVRSIDSAPHKVSIYDSTSSELAVNHSSQSVEWKRETAGPLTSLRVGTHKQGILQSYGDDHRIDWGYAYVAAPTAQSTAAIGADEDLVNSFVTNGTLPAADDTLMPRPVFVRQPVMAFVFDLSAVTSEPVSRQVIVAYDEIDSILYFGQKLQPYWRRDGMEPLDLLQKASTDYPALETRCENFDKELMEDLTKVGGDRYAQICALSYRECVAACGLAADANKQPLFFTKENTSNGDIATVDVFFPMDPVWILLSPTLAEASLVSVLQFGSMPEWKYPNSPHDLGTYPIARGYDGGAGEDMPVEESGNMIILCDAIAQAKGSADFITPWWPSLTKWADFLQQFGLDPGDQLSTDDFMGHLNHNSNLSIKAIVALAAYGDLCKMRGDTANADKYTKNAKADALHWMQVAADGDHYLLAFDKPNTWSQKYNLVWDHILGLNVFPPEVAQKEVAYYLKVKQPYGVPLDSRTHLTKTDWSIWSATLADNQNDFEAIISPIYNYLNETSSRDPLSDSYQTDDVRSGGMHARPVVGGFFIKMLTDPAIWQKWASRDKTPLADWKPLPHPPYPPFPQPPKFTEIVPTADESPTPVTWRYTTTKPADNWTHPDFDASSWTEAPAPFGTDGTPNIKVKTKWDTGDIWMRRDFVMPESDATDLEFHLYHDDDVEIYINGVFASMEPDFVDHYGALEMTQEAKALLVPGAKITMAVHCHQQYGGQGIDVGLGKVVSSPQDDSNAPPK